MRVAFGLIAATCATPIAVATMFSVLYALQIGWFEGKDWDLVLDNMKIYATFSAPIALFVTVAAGGPLAHRLKHLGHRGFLHHALVGVILGAAPFVLFDGYIIGTKLLLDVRPAPDTETVMTAARWAALGSWCGFWSAWAHWLVVVRERPSERHP